MRRCGVPFAPVETARLERSGWRRKDDEKTEGRSRGGGRDNRQSAARSFGCRRQADDQGRRRKRGFVTHDELNSPSCRPRKSRPTRLKISYVMLNEMGINVVDSGRGGRGRGPAEEAAEEEEARGGRGGRGAARRAKAVVTRTSEPADRTDDPVRMYLREMGSVELLSREGEIAIAKRIEAGREAMIAGLCESPLTFQAIIIWRDELNGSQGAAARHHRPRGDLCGARRQEYAENRHDRAGRRTKRLVAQQAQHQAPATAPLNAAGRPASRSTRTATAEAPIPEDSLSRTRTIWRIPYRSPPWKPN